MKGMERILISQVSVKTDSISRFADVYETNDIMRITDYSYMDKELLIQKVGEKSKLVIGGKKLKDKVTNIDDLIRWAEIFIEVALGILNSENVVYEDNKIEYMVDEERSIDYWYWLDYRNKINQWMDESINSCRKWKVDYSITKVEKEMLINQLVFDMLYDFYLRQSPRMMIKDYVSNLVKQHALVGDELSGKEAKRKTIQNGMVEYYKKLSTPKLREQLEMLGVNADAYPEYYLYKGERYVEKPKYVWDQLYYNKYMITGKQYRRNYTRDGRNYPYWEIYKDLYEYNQFVEELLPKRNDYGDIYLKKTMDYFTLEAYKRIDYMFKLAIDMPLMEIEEKDVEFLLKRFHPEVMIPFNDNGNVGYDKKNKYYRPLFMIENSLLEELRGGSDCSAVGQKLFKCQVIRAKAYELISYNVEILNENSIYDGVEKFLRKSYDAYSYHKSNTIWEDIDTIDYEKKENDKRKRIRERVTKVMEINKLLFK